MVIDSVQKSHYYPGVVLIRHGQCFILFFTFLFHHLRPRDCGVPEAKARMGRSVNGCVTRSRDSRLVPLLTPVNITTLL